MFTRRTLVRSGAVLAVPAVVVLDQRPTAAARRLRRYDGDGTHPFMQANPHIEFHNSLRGYSLLTLEPAQLTVDYRVVSQVQVADALPAPTAERVERAPADPARATLREELGLNR